MLLRSLLPLFLIITLAVSCNDDEALPAPVVTTLSVDNGVEGTTPVTITGSNFSKNPSDVIVKFNGIVANISSATGTQLVVTVPLGASSGVVTVTVNKKTAVGPNFTVYAKLTLAETNPTSAIAGTSVPLTGTGFSTIPGENIVKFNGTLATVVSASSTQLTVTVPATATSGALTVSANSQTVSSPSFSVLPALTIILIEPIIGVVNNLVTINGTGFSTTPNLNLVKFNGTIAEVTSATAFQLKVKVPAFATTGAITVATNTQEVTGSIFTVPVGITSISPSTAQVETIVAINGFGFSPTPAFNSVYFEGTAATTPVLTASSTQLVVRVPIDAQTGHVFVSVNDQWDLTGPIITVDPTPTITSIEAPVVAGSQMIIEGTGFSKIAGENIVYINGVLASVSSATLSQLIVNVPESATTGAVTVTVNGFTTVGPVVIILHNPTITSISPTSGQVGTAVTLTGTYFSTVPGKNYVGFGSTFVQATNVSSTQIVAVVPEGSVTGPTTIFVEGLDGFGPVFTVVPTDPVEPPVGPTNGTITIDGLTKHYVTTIFSDTPTSYRLTGVSPPDASFSMEFSSKPTHNGIYVANIYAVWQGLEYGQSAASVTVTIAGSKMTITFTDVPLSPLNTGPAKQMSGEIVMIN